MLPEGTRLSAVQLTLMRRLTRRTRISFRPIELRRRRAAAKSYPQPTAIQFWEYSSSVAPDGSPLCLADKLGEARLTTALDSQRMGARPVIAGANFDGRQPEAVRTAVYRYPVVADVKRGSAGMFAVGLARVSDSVSQHSVKLALAEFLGLSSNCLPGHLLCLRVGTGGQQRRPSLRDRHYLGFCCWRLVTTLQAQTI